MPQDTDPFEDTEPEDPEKRAEIVESIRMIQEQLMLKGLPDQELTQKEEHVRLVMSEMFKKDKKFRLFMSCAQWTYAKCIKKGGDTLYNFGTGMMELEKKLGIDDETLDREEG